MRENAWKTAGYLTNPLINAVIADTGATPIKAGQYSVKLPMSASAATKVIVEFWSADETIELIRSHVYHLAANIMPPQEFVRNYPFTRDFRVYLKMVVALTGTIQGAIVVE
jgi:uncharacterized protein (DUF1330 family)